MKLFGERVNYKIKYQRRVGAYGIILQKNDLILTEQITKENGIELQLPGGGTNENESLIRALYREVLEETGWLISNPRFLGVYKRFVYMPEYKMYAEKVCKIYHAIPSRKTSNILEKGHSAHIMHAHLALRLLHGGDLHFLETHLKKFQTK